MADALLTLEQRRAIHGADAWMQQTGLPTYTELLGALELYTWPAVLPAAGHIELEPLDSLETTEDEARTFTAVTGERNA